MLRVTRSCLFVVALVFVAAWLSAGCAADDPDVALRVNGHPVTYEEIAKAKAQFTSYRDDVMRDHIEQIDTAYPDFRPWLEGIARVHDKYSVDAAAIGGIVIEYAEYDAAIKAGFSASDDEVAEVISTMRSQHEQFSKIIEEYGIEESDGCIKVAGIDDPDGCIKVAGIDQLDSIAEYKEAMGADKYWNETLPALIRRNSAVAKWKDAAHLELASAQEGYGEGGVSSAEWARIQLAVALSALADVNVEVVDKTMFDEATVRDALEYSREITYAFYPD